MKIDLDKIISLSDLQDSIEAVCRKVNEKQELLVFQDNRPSYIFMTVDRYEKLLDKVVYEGYDELKEQDTEIVEVLLNKIGKKVFIDYYYIFKEDIEPEEKLTRDFTINSRRSRSSSARQIFRNGLEIEALKNIIESNRLDFETLDQAKTILKNEEKGIFSSEGIGDVYENESERELKIGKMARILITRFFKNKLITLEEITLMQEEIYSKNIFNLNFPVLKEVDKNIDFEEQKKDDRGYNRYYNKAISFHGREYLLCSQWVEDLHKSALERWIESKLMDVLKKYASELEVGSEFTIPELLNEYWQYVSHGTRKSLGRKFVDKARNSVISNVIEIPNSKRKNSQVYKKI